MELLSSLNNFLELLLLFLFDILDLLISVFLDIFNFGFDLFELHLEFFEFRSLQLFRLLGDRGENCLKSNGISIENVLGFSFWSFSLFGSLLVIISFSIFLSLAFSVISSSLSSFAFTSFILTFIASFRSLFLNLFSSLLGLVVSSFLHVLFVIVTAF